MRHLLIALLVIGNGSLVFAEQARIIKIKGNQAIVQFPPDAKFEVGQAVEIAGHDSSYARSNAGEAKSYTLGLSGSLTSLSLDESRSNVSPAGYSTLFPSTSKSSTTGSLVARFGWNRSLIEFGPLLETQLGLSGWDQRKAFLAGGFFDFNFAPNNGSNTFIYGVGAEGEVGYLTGTYTVLVNSANVDVTTSGPKYKGAGGVFVKWFAHQLPVAVRVDLQYSYDRTTENWSAPATTNTSVTGSTTSTTSGVVGKLGMQVYF
jgi:hypothetical protein